MATLAGKRVAFLATDGVEQVELTGPWQAVRDAGAEAVLVSPKPDEIQGFEHVDKADRFTVDAPVDKADATDYDALIVPGGVVNADFLRADADSVAFTRAFFEQRKPVSVICHGPWVLIEADVVAGRKLTSWPSLRTDLRNAGAIWEDLPVVVDQGLVTSRKPDDLLDFCVKTIEEISEGTHSGQGRFL